MRSAIQLFCVSAPAAVAFNFNFEFIQLTESDIGNFSAIAFGNRSALSSAIQDPACKAYPGTPAWPFDDEWNRLNMSLDGALLKPSPVASVCYSGPLHDLTQCNYLISNGRQGRFYINDPLTVLTSWPQGDTCALSKTPQGNCTQGGFPVYVVNATTVKQIQVAVNFARNKNIRLVIKNTGHDFVGRSTGFGGLSIWSHHLKSFDFLPLFAQGDYNGMAAKVGSGLEAWELYSYMNQHNMTLVVPGGSTVGAYGGWMAGGGHSNLGSIYGLGSDQPLSLQVVTADGRFLTADPNQNQGLFYALRGGGPGTYGIVTSAIVKAYPPVHVSETPIRFSVGTSFRTNMAAFNLTNPTNWTRLPDAPFNNRTRDPPVNVDSLDTFWAGVSAYFRFGPQLCDGGGTGYSYIQQGNNSLSFTTTLELPGMTKSEAFTFVQPLITALNAAGVPVNNTMPVTSLSWGSTRKGEGDSPGNSRFGTRLFPRKNWEDEKLFNATMKALRATTEAGYSFHGVQIAPGEKTAGYPGNSAVNPAFRETLMHADLFDRGSMRAGAGYKEARAKFADAMGLWRAVTPGGGAYVNEADALEPDWQQSFWGSNYDRLLEIKKERDPWGVFWAPTTVGSEGWEVRSEDGMPTQNGPLCRVGRSA